MTAKSLLGRRLSLLLYIPILVISLVPTSIVRAADPNQLFISPPSSQMNIGAPITLNVRRFDPNAPSSGNVSGTVTYPANLLKVLETPPNGSVYGSPSISQGSGTITFNGTQSSPSGSIAQIFSIRFEAIAAGTATIGFAGGSQVNNGTTIYKSGVLTIINPNPAPSQPQPSVSATPKVAAPTIITPSPVVEAPPVVQSDPQPTPDPTGLVDDVGIEALYTSATVNWKIDASNPSSAILYGKTASQLDSKGTVTRKADGSFTTTITGLVPGSRYYFKIDGNGDGGKSGSYSGTLIARGFPVVLTITENGQATKSAQVKIGSRTYATTSEGKVSIGLAAGKYSGTIVTSTAALTINLTVEAKTIPPDGTAPDSQSFSYNLVSSPLEQGPGSGTTILSFIGVLIGGTAVIAIVFVGFMAYRRRKLEMGNGISPTSSTVIIDDGYEWHGQETTEPQIISRPEPPISYMQPPNSAVSITDEEPVDMFDKAVGTPLPTPSVDRPGEMPRTTNQPHSTKP